MHQKDTKIKQGLSIGKKQQKPINAYIMTKMYPGAYNRALDELKKLNNIEKISFVTGTGNYDIVMKVNVKNLGSLHRLVSQLQGIEGVERTNTHVIVKEYNVLTDK